MHQRYRLIEVFSRQKPMQQPTDQQSGYQHPRAISTTGVDVSFLLMARPAPNEG